MDKLEVCMNIYAGNLSFDTTEDELRTMFEEYGEVSSVAIIKDKFSGESRGFGFVEMASKEEAMTAIAELNQTDHEGRTLKINEAKPRNDSRGGGRDNRGRRY